MIAPPYLTPAERFDRLMQAVCEAIAAQHKEGRLFGPLLILTWRRLRQAGVKVLALAASYAAGRLPWRPRPLRPYRPRPQAAEEAPTQAAAPQAPEKLKLPTGFGWLLGRARVGFGREHLMRLLADPEMQDMIAVIPQVAHHLRPICRMLGVKPPPGLFPERRRPRRPTPPAKPPAPPKAGRGEADGWIFPRPGEFSWKECNQSRRINLVSEPGSGWGGDLVTVPPSRYKAGLH